MSESDTALHDEEVFSDELPDAVFGGCGEQILARAREFRYDWILLRARNLPHGVGVPPAPIILRGGAANIAKLPELAPTVANRSCSNS